MKRARSMFVMSNLLILALLLSISGCSSGPSPDEVTKNFFDALIEGEFEKVAELTGNEVLKTNENEQSEHLAKSIYARITYDIGDTKIEGDTAKVNVKVTTLDMVLIASRAMAELLPMAFAKAVSEEQSQEKMDAWIDQYFENAVRDPNAPMITLDIQVELEKEGSSWIVLPTDAFANVLTGNLAGALGGLEEMRIDD